MGTTDTVTKITETGIGMIAAEVVLRQRRDRDRTNDA
jgi:hypothetical protein